MSQVPRRKIEELCVLYRLNPSVRDIFVEGAEDVAVIGWYLRRRCTRSVSVREVSVVEIPATGAGGDSDGQRDRILALARQFDQRLVGDQRRCPTMVYDSDLDRVLGGLVQTDMLVATDFSCMEMYLYSERVADKLMSVVLKGCKIAATQALDEMTEPLRNLWTFKAANQVCGWKMTWVQFDGCCTLVGNALHFDKDVYIERY